MRNLQWYLMIEGVGRGWYSGAVPNGAPLGTVARTMTRAVEDVTVASPETLDVQVGIATGGTFGVRLKLDDTTRDLIRIGPRGASYVFSLATTIDQATAAGDVLINEAIPAAVPAAGYAHIGQECFSYNGKVAGPPGQFQNFTRAQFDSRQRSHRVESSAKGGAPYVTLEPLTWLGRGARVLCADVPMGVRPVTADWIEVCRGYLREAPTVSEDGLFVDVVVTPWISAIGRTVGGPTSQTQLQQGYHAFDGETGSWFLGLVQTWKPGAAFEVISGATSAPSNTFIWPWAQHSRIFDVTSGDRNRRGPIEDCQSHPAYYYLDPTLVLAYQGAPGIDVSTGPFSQLDLTIHPAGIGAGIIAGTHFRNGLCNVTVAVNPLPVPGAPIVMPWPDAGATSYNSLLNDQLDIGAAYGATLWAWHSIQRSADAGGWELTSRLVGPGSPSKSLTLRMKTPPRNALWYGLSLATPEESVVPVLTDVGAGRSARHTNWAEYESECNTPPDTDLSLRNRLPIKGYADAYYQTGELYFLCEDDISEGRSLFPVTVSFVDWNGEEKRVSCYVNEVKPASDITAGVPGYTYEVVRPWILQSFGDWSGQDRAVVRLAARFANEEPTEILRKLLISSEGKFWGGAYDVLPWGLGLSADDVDVRSITSFPLPGGACSRVHDFTIIDETSLDDLIGSVLRLIGGALVSRLGADGRRRVTLVRVGLPVAQDEAAALADDRWHLRGRPRTEIEQAIENVLELDTTQDYVTGDTRVKVRLENATLVKENDGRTEVYSDSAPWLTLTSGSVQEARAALLPVAMERWSLYGYPRIVIRGTISAEDAEGLFLGAVVRVYASEVRLYDGSRGMAGGYCTVVEIAMDRWRTTCEVALIYWGSVGTGYAPSMLCTVVSSATSFTVAANQYTETTDWRTGAAQRDSDYFKAGDVVRIVPPDYAASAVRTILSVVGNVVTFTAAHGISSVATRTTIRPDTYDSNTGRVLEGYAFIADSGGALGAAAVPGFQFV